MKEWFPYWDAWNYNEFLDAKSKFGREDIHKIEFSVNKSIEKVKKYLCFLVKGRQTDFEQNYFWKKANQHE